MPTHATLGFILNDNKVLLIYKKRGFGEGKYNGPGGKLEVGETPKEAVIREIIEELGVKMIKPEEKGLLNFYFGDNPDPDWIVHIFTSHSYQGRVRDSEEASGHWFEIDKIPYDKMWEDDIYWLPDVLQGNTVNGKFWFEKDSDKLISHTLKIEKSN